MAAPTRSSQGPAGAARRLRHDEPQDQPPAHRFVESYLRRHGVDSARVPTPDGAEGQPVRHHRACRCRRHCALRPHRRGAGDGPGLEHRSVHAGRARRQALRPRRLRHEGLSRLRARHGARVQAARKLATPIHIAFSYDEEVGCTGVRPMVAELGKTLPLPRMVLVGEPTSMTVVDAHKGPMRWACEVTGKAAHSTMPHLGVNAITYAGRLLGELARIEEELEDAAARMPRFDPPYTTLQVTEIAGGTASNIVPAPCWFGWEIRRLPGFDGTALDAAPPPLRRGAVPGRRCSGWRRRPASTSRSSTRCRRSRPMPPPASCRSP